MTGRAKWIIWPYRDHRAPRSLIGTSVALSISLAGCAVGPAYKAPTTSLSPFHNLQAVEHGSVASPAPQLDRWWTGFNDAMLVTVVQRALDENVDLAASLARVQQARSAAAGAGAQLLPTVDLNASATVDHQSLESPLGSLTQSAVPGLNRDQREYVVGPAANWEIDLAGGLRRGAAAATDEAEAAQAERAGTQISVVADAADAYLQVRGLQARFAVAQDQIETDAHLPQLVQVRRDAGQAEDRETVRKVGVPSLRGTTCRIRNTGETGRSGES
jgi:outer membrane protein TolC